MCVYMCVDTLKNHLKVALGHVKQDRDRRRPLGTAEQREDSKERRKVQLYRRS